jgi:hypothetical protein
MRTATATITIALVLAEGLWAFLRPIDSDGQADNLIGAPL